MQFAKHWEKMLAEGNALGRMTSKIGFRAYLRKQRKAFGLYLLGGALFVTSVVVPLPPLTGGALALAGLGAFVVGWMVWMRTDTRLARAWMDAYPEDARPFSIIDTWRDDARRSYEAVEALAASDPATKRAYTRSATAAIFTGIVGLAGIASSIELDIAHMRGILISAVLLALSIAAGTYAYLTMKRAQAVQ